MATLNFNAREVAPSAPAGIVPAGDYNVQIVKSEIKPTRDGQSHYLTLEFEILDGECKGRHLWANLNLWNANETASRIAQQQLSAIAHAVNVLDVSDSELLHNKPLLVTVAVKKGTAEYPDDKNEVKGYAAYRGAQAMAPAPVVASAPSFAAPTAPVANPFAAPVAQAPAPIVPAPVAPQAPAFAAPAPVAAPSFAPPAQAAPVANPFAAPAAGAPQPWAVKS